MIIRLVNQKGRVGEKLELLEFDIEASSCSSLYLGLRNPSDAPNASHPAD
jgi:hypothetical protein